MTDLSQGLTTLSEVPAPQVRPQSLLIGTRASVLSAGTERMLLQFGKANLLGKARQQPDKVRQVLDKVRTDGLLTTLDAVRSKLESPIGLGYCNAGRVLEVGPAVEGFQVGERVVSNGYHADVVCVGKNLCAKIPDGVPDEDAAFTVLGAIALQGVRLAQPTLGETFAVIGLGLVGLLTVQLLRANGCQVLGLDFDPQRRALAERWGATTADPGTQDPVAVAQALTQGRGVDGVLIAAATPSNDPVKQAAHMCRTRGRIVLVGVVGLELDRADFYAKELSFQVSCSYGPGRYDPDYEDRGQDYPLGFVRWTEQRNFEAVLGLLAEGALEVEPLITHRFPFDDALQAYQTLDGDREALGIVLSYPGVDTVGRAQRVVEYSPTPTAPGACTVGVLGAGNFAQRVLLPAMAKTSAQLHTVASSGGSSAAVTAKKLGFARAAADPAHVLEDPQVDTVFVLTRHDTHADYVVRGLEAGKHVFVEKPLALTLDQLDAVEAAYAQAPAGTKLMVGFNRRFAPLVQEARRLLAVEPAPKSLLYTVNAGAIPADHWLQRADEGGGRIVGEACHFVDLARFLVGAPLTAIQATPAATQPGAPRDSATLVLSFADGSSATVLYWTNGHRAVPKERVEVFCGGKSLAIDNFRSLTVHGWTRRLRLPGLKQDKGHQAEVRAFVEAVEGGGPPPIPIEELFEVSRFTLEAAEQLRQPTPR